MSHLMKRIGALLFVGALSLAGCAGSDGKDGAPGANGAPGARGSDGAPGQDLTSDPVETCAGCHGGSLASRHAQQNVVMVSGESTASVDANGTTTVNPVNLVVKFNIKVDGVNRSDFTSVAFARNTTTPAFYTWTYPDPGTVSSIGGVRTEIKQTDVPFTFASTGSGNYALTVPGWGSAGTPPQPGTTFLVRVTTPSGLLPATAVVHFGGRAHKVVDNSACIACHGDYVFSKRDDLGNPVGHHGLNPRGVEACTVCHNLNSNTETRLGGTSYRLMGYVHGIHASHGMPAKDLDPSPAVTVIKPEGVYARNGSKTNNAETWFSVGFPGAMNNCATCHTDPTTGGVYASIANAPVSYALCASCHDSWATTKNPRTPTSHKNWTRAQDAQAIDCTGCHSVSGGEFATVAEAHNAATYRNPVTGETYNRAGGRTNVRGDLVWNGADQSVLLGKRMKLEITGVAFEPVGSNTLAVSWTASFDADGDGTFTAVDPCNADVTAGPVFHRAAASTTGTGMVGSNFALYRTYGIGDDWVAGTGTANAPGQPNGSVSLTATNTSCTGTVAKTRVRADSNVTLARAQVALGGKPQVRFDPTIGTSVEVITIRAKSPTLAFNPATGATLASRRQIVSMDKCNACHTGTMYQHGGDRVDSVDMCVVCHNPAANEKNVRVGYGVTAGEAYDGKVGETYDFKNLIHALHSSGETQKPLVIYRTRGIYYFGPKSSLPSTWPTPNDPVSVSTTIYGSTASQVHNIIEVHYPRPLADCAACHVSDVTSFADPKKAVAVTVDPGAAPFVNVADDVLQGANATACMSCHQSNNAFTQLGLRQHAYDQGWTPVTFPNGRQTIIDAAP